MKRHISFILIFLLVISLVACGSKEVGNNSQPITVRISIDVKTALDKGYLDYDYILEELEVQATKSDTVWDILDRATKEKGIAVVKRGNGERLYISHIDSIGEFDFEKTSGWVFLINGEMPSYGAASKKVQIEDGDLIQWRFTLNVGKDLGKEIN